VWGHTYDQVEGRLRMKLSDTFKRVLDFVNPPGTACVLGQPHVPLLVLMPRAPRAGIDRTVTQLSSGRGRHGHTRQ